MAGRTCGNCGAPAPAPFLAPPPETAPDLDGRPGEPARSTLHRWVRVCSGCNAAAPDLSAVLPGPVPDEPDPIRRWADEARRNGPPRTEVEAQIWAAWAADDAGDAAAARIFRIRAAEAWPPPDHAADGLRLADVARRAGEFGLAATVLDRLEPDDEQTAAIAAFLRDRVAARDDNRHMLSSALRPPARRPHVSHVQPRRRSFWTRLTGR